MRHVRALLEPLLGTQHWLAAAGWQSFLLPLIVTVLVFLVASEPQPEPDSRTSQGGGVFLSV
ncbi:hypothetical protein K461DRAFT_172138 [Myriangium duriaei CBS 260.36]|uniref:Uncharacterized protein n=1 Tax=Myriangium duriaei CBS 260.36 TaxID=1168546 RepID=A0A9P4MIT3_9PEZI|nr:hypothetical protein K461DRAFT_172138 [Myriangium duriaei CBS 260.36]